MTELWAGGVRVSVGEREGLCFGGSVKGNG